jgi:DNA-binding response OmpR family regulator
MADLMNTNGKSLWLLEDDKGCQFVYEQTLDHRYTTRYFERLDDFVSALESTPKDELPQMIVADLMLGDGNFLNFLTNSKDSNILNIPFIIVSSIDDIDALRFCFKEGALDYLTKPFKKNELLVKIENVLSGGSRPRTVETGHKSVNLDGNDVQNLTAKQKQLLALFLESRDRSITRNDILEKVWGSTNVHPKTVDVHLYNLRRKLHSFGYMIRSEGGGRWALLSDRVEN